MLGRLALSAAIILGISSSEVYCQEAQSITLRVNNRSPFEVAPSVRIQNDWKPFEAKGNGVFEYKFSLSAEKWFSSAHVKIFWKEAYEDAEGKRLNDEQYLVLRLRRIVSDPFSIDVHFANVRTAQERRRLDSAKNINQQFEVLFRALQIARYYRETGADEPFGKAARIAFYAALHLAEYDEHPYVIVMADDVENLVKEALGLDDKNTFSETAKKARSLYWRDLSYIHDYVRKKDCATARLILYEFGQLKRKEPDLFRLAYPDEPTALEDKEAIVARGCGKR